MGRNRVNFLLGLVVVLAVTVSAMLVLAAVGAWIATFPVSLAV